MKREIIVGMFFLIAIGFLSGVFNLIEKNKASATIYKVGSATIDMHSICRVVTNTGSVKMMIPTKTKDEWCSFLKNVSSFTPISVNWCTITECIGRCCNKTRTSLYNNNLCD